MQPVSVIVPIFNQASLVEQCVFSVLSAKVETPFQLLLVNDASTEAEVDDVLSKFSGDDRVRCISNEENKGFTKTANVGIREAGRTDPLLLNSDTIVYDNWLDVLVDALHSAPDIASVTPMTNQCGSHISCYPDRNWAENNALGLVDRELANTAFETCRKLTAKVHTGVGFCLLLNRDCLNEIGELDEVNFPRGYGEESDFCYRASYLGWSHLVAGGAFVTHLHGKSFGDEKTPLRDAMLPTFRRLHPSQPSIDRGFRERDPIQPLRRALDLGRLKHSLAGNSVLQILADPERGDVLDQPFLLVDSAEPGSARFTHAQFGAEFPNIEHYILPSDIFRLICDLKAIGVKKLIFLDHINPLEHCLEFVESSSLGSNLGVSSGTDFLHFANSKILTE